ncbi:MAG: methylmalonyl Co-A mutase-associated GTPase MeaB [Alphaproteobacteria bacterium]|nr:methylmalonyl Co-A mutase-associated GTPase MeaB [Alphaproteobacteria bacterium]MBU0799305.1 methylmalonyl Co-A mutase-associated GTPase MeaB [Alphaproteobacteria bacterium]MBU0885741.1 methylmalonyl Co-A mutase-associated GTPase MeaB [Alphaproteobacteria bacterium]MBU1814444.1 methylmalonyl Co-A mutase-associated GTPase MeaB [Alphaproteobacteria bacterium]
MGAAPGLAALRAGGKPALARALAQIERFPDRPDTLELLAAAYAAPFAQVLGVTGPPGVGKSTLLGALIREYRQQGLTIGVIAVDPSSRRSGGALLGDRTRLDTDPADDGIFVRSMAARDRLGGLAAISYAAMILMRALYDRVILETVGVGQSETDVAGVADTVLFCVQPGSGDSLQFMKAGIAEIPHVIAVTKADMTEAAGRAVADVTGALGLAEAVPDGWAVPVLAVSARTGVGITALLTALDAHTAHLRPVLAGQRHAQAETWLHHALRERWGTHGLACAGTITLPAGEAPFRRLSAYDCAAIFKHP